jgi:CHAT domain-containing protein
MLLRTGTSGLPGQPPVAPLVLEHFVSASESTLRHGGVSLYRPRNLDQLIASDYLKLRFNQKIHWTVLLAVINLIGNHPRALWRILSALLATADNNTRAQLIDRITGPGSVIAPFREQFVVLAPVRAFVLSLEPDPSAAVPATGPARRSDAYRVRLELADREAFITEFRSVVDPDALQGVIDGLVKMLKAAAPLSLADAKRLESLGETLGEDILQDLGVKLTEANRGQDQVHLQLQIPRELMKYPWELMHYKDGWLSEHFAMGRQVFSRMGGGVVRSRVPGPLRALVIGNPPTSERTLPYAAQEAEQIARTFAALASETDGLLDFDRGRDAFINQEITREQLRELLRHGNYDIIHFAGHAVFDPEHPASSAWLLSDGRLSAQAIRNTLRWLDTQPWLVYANACEAGMDDDGAAPVYQSDVFGLASAFLDHGVSVFIGPLWRIDDGIAARIAQTFYQQLLKERQTVGEALRLAKAEAKHFNFDALLQPSEAAGSAQRVALISWAGLVLYGNSTATFGQRAGAPPPPEAPVVPEA